MENLLTSTLFRMLHCRKRYCARRYGVFGPVCSVIALLRVSTMWSEYPNDWKRFRILSKRRASNSRFSMEMSRKELWCACASPGSAEWVLKSPFVEAWETRSPLANMESLWSLEATVLSLSSGGKTGSGSTADSYMDSGTDSMESSWHPSPLLEDLPSRKHIEGVDETFCLQTDQRREDPIDAESSRR